VVVEAQAGFAHVGQALGEGPDAARERLVRLGAAAAAVAGDPPVDAVVSRARRRSAALVAGGAVVLALVAAGAAWQPRSPAASAADAVPAGDGGPGGTMSRDVEGPPYPVPGPPYREVYRDVPLVLPDPQHRCGTEFGVDLHDPRRVGAYPYAGGVSRGDVSRGAECEDGLMRRAYFSAPTENVDDPGIGPEGCADAFLDGRFSGAADGPGTVKCLISAADPARGRPLLLVRLVTVSDDVASRVEYRATAWTGGTPVMSPP
jgi:hypothetical protein